MTEKTHTTNPSEARPVHCHDRGKAAKFTNSHPPSAASPAARELLADALKYECETDLDAFVIEDEQGHHSFLPIAEAIPRRLRG